jgi:MerR family transcriptional regulator, light-induced transcriptional regulator
MAQRPGNEPKQARLLELARAYAAALLAGDEVAAEVAIRDALADGLGAAEINDQIITPALWLIGELWARGEISVAVEHAATEISLRVLALQQEAQRTRRQRHGRRVLVAAPAGELHIVALRMAANLLIGAGYRVVMLGGDVPPAALADAVVTHGTDVVCMSATMAGGTDRLLVAIHEVQTARPGSGFVLGGRALTSRVRGLPGIDVCERVSDVVEAVDAMLKRPHAN